jgi:membrane carboxypeptidase/penicillin-binding protein PbpC
MPAFGAGSVLETPYGAAVKTGTSSLFRDSWTVGFTSEVAVGVWVGNPDGRPMRDLPGADGAAPIWRQVMDAAEEARPSRGFEAPSDLVRAPVCAPTGLTPGDHCAVIAEEWFAAGTEPAATETYYVAAGASVAERAPVDAQPWTLDTAVATAPGIEGATAGQETGNLEHVAIVQPAAGSVLYLAPEFGGSEALLRAAVPPGTVRVTFAIDGQHVAEIAGDDARVRWALQPGTHDLLVAAVQPDGSTVRARSTFEVR